MNDHSVLSDPGPDHAEKSHAQVMAKRSLLYRWFKKRRHAINDFMARYSRIPNAPLIDKATFEWTATLADQAGIIQAEAEAVYRHLDAIPPLKDLSPDHKRIAEDNKWRSFFLVGYGHKVEENCARAPRTAALVENIEGLNSAFFSILAPGAHIPRHRGVTKAFITAHLGLQIPSKAADCEIAIGDQHRHWESGEWLMFDDTYPHEVWNRTNEPRIVLLLQVKRPLAFPGSLVAWSFMTFIKNSPFVREARDNLKLWETAYKAAEDNIAA